MTEQNELHKLNWRSMCCFGKDVNIIPKFQRMVIGYVRMQCDKKNFIKT